MSTTNDDGRPPMAPSPRRPAAAPVAAAPRWVASQVADAALPMCVAWGDGLAAVWNPAFAALLPEAHAPGAPLRALCAALWHDVGPLVERALAGAGATSGDLPATGGAAWFALAVAPLRDEAGAVRGVSCTAWDTTAKVTAQRRLVEQAGEAGRRDAQARETGERYRLARLATNDAIWDWRLNDGQVVWNRALHALFGYDLEQTSADWWIEHIHPEDRPQVDATIHAVIDAGGMAWSGEYRFRRADGSYAEIFDRGTVLRDARGRAVRMIGAMVDLSERRATQRALQESERLFRTLFESIDEGFCVIEFLDGPHGPLSDYVHVMANPAYAAHTGIPDAVGRRVRAMVPLEADGWVAIYRRVLVTGEPVRFERELEHTGRYLELAALRIEPVERRQVAVLFQDITSRHRAEVAMRGMNDILERRVAEEVAERARTEDALRQAQKMEAVGKLTGGIAHDFNNMLAVISNALELLDRRFTASDERARHYVGMAKGGVRRAAQLTQRLLAFSRQQPLQPVAVAPNDLVAGMSELLRHSLGADVAFETALADDAWTIHVDPNQLENTVLNLVVNARDAMEQGGRLVVETANRVLDERAAAALGGVAPGDYLMLAIRDTGSGMSDDVMARAFDPFFTTKEVGRGTGLGLSQVYGFVRQSGGHVQIESAPGRGTVVRAYLPRHALAPADRPARTPAPGIPRGRAGEEILVVEDETSVRVLLADMLANLGYRVFAADGGHAALQVLEAQPGIGLLVTDVVMPVMNGRELADAALQRRPRLKVLFTTGYSRNILVTNGVLGHDVQLLAKPFALDELAARVRALFDPP